MAKWEKEIKNLKAHEIIILDSLKEKDKEVKSAKVEEVKELHETARKNLLNTLVDTVKKRNQFEFKTVCWYGDVTEDEEDEQELPDVLVGRGEYQIVGIRYYTGVAHPGEFVVLVREPRNE